VSRVKHPQIAPYEEVIAEGFKKQEKETSSRESSKEPTSAEYIYHELLK
jgi:hypothetical protein